MTSATNPAPAIGHRLPAFYCPVPPAVHPRVREIEQRAIAWLDANGVFPDGTERAWGIATNAAEFSCRLAPHGDEERVLLFAQWNYWLFALDDNRLDGGPVAGRGADVIDIGLRMVRCLEAPGSTMLGHGPVASALADLVSRTRAATTAVQFQRLTEGVRDLFLGVAWQNGNAERGVVPTLSDFVSGRISDVGGRFDAAFIEIANGIEVPAGQLYSDAVRTLTEVTSFIVACDNDVLSYAKEDGESGQNIVSVLAHHRGCSREEAVTAAFALRDRAMTLFCALHDQVMRDAGPELRCYLEGLGHFITGNVHWSDTAPRYASPRNRHELPVAGSRLGVTVRETPRDGGTEPPGVPGIDGWWDQLTR